jgi:hypothetical protein
VEIAISKIDSSRSLSNNRSSAFSDSSSIFSSFFSRVSQHEEEYRAQSLWLWCWMFPWKMSYQHPMWIKKVTLTCEVLAIPDATSMWMWNILMIENHIVGEPLPTCFPCMFSKKNDAVVVAPIQNLEATPLMDFFTNQICR